MKAAESVDVKQDEGNIQKELHLHTTPSQFSLFQWFYRNTGETVSKE
jgi:hypothetical protein